MSLQAQRLTLLPEPGGKTEIAATVQGLAARAGLRGWVRGDASADEPVRIHAEGDPAILRSFGVALATLAVDEAVGAQEVRPEGHEQFAVRGVSAGTFVVQEHRARAHHYDLRLEVDGVMRSWAVPKGPSLDPAVKRLAVQVGDHSLAHNAFEGTTDSGGVIVWDRGTYEQGGRVPWPEALTRGHAVFVLHGEKLAGGFALQRTGEGRAGEAAGGTRQRPPQWLLLKRRDGQARPGSDVTAELPASVVSGSTLAELIGGR